MISDLAGCTVGARRGRFFFATLTSTIAVGYLVVSRSTIGGGGGDVTILSPFWEGTARKHPLPGTYLTNPLVNDLNAGQACRPCGGDVVLSPEGVVLVTSPGMESSYPRPPQSSKHSRPLSRGTTSGQFKPIGGTNALCRRAPDVYCVSSEGGREMHGVVSCW